MKICEYLHLSVLPSWMDRTRMTNVFLPYKLAVHRIPDVCNVRSSLPLMVRFQSHQHHKSPSQLFRFLLQLAGRRNRGNCKITLRIECCFCYRKSLGCLHILTTAFAKSTAPAPPLEKCSHTIAVKHVNNLNVLLITFECAVLFSLGHEHFQFIVRICGESIGCHTNLHAEFACILNLFT